MRNLSLVLLPALLGACAIVPSNNQPVLHAYTGPQLPEAELAHLYCARTLIIHSIDGNEAYTNTPKGFLANASACNFALQPGLHILLASYSKATTTINGTSYESTKPFPASITVEAGKTYTLKPVFRNNPIDRNRPLVSVSVVELPAGTPYNADSAYFPR